MTRRCVSALTLLLCAAAGARADDPIRIRFDSSRAQSETRLALAELPGDLPADWRSHEALVLELRASSPQRINFRVYTADGASRILLHPYPGVWVRAALPVSMLGEPPKTGHDMAAVGNRSRQGYFASLWGPFAPLKDVEAIGFEMVEPVGDPTLEIRSVALETVSPGDAVQGGLPLVDALGQSVHDSWPGKAASVEALREAWRAEEAGLKPGDYGYCGYGGYAATRAEATGFFRVEEVDGRFWFVDPDGHLFLSVGADVVQPEMVTRTAGREAFFEALPPAALRTGRMRDGDPGASFFTWNLLRRFGEGWEKDWIDTTLRRMDDWGLNTVANWSDPGLYDTRRKPYAVPLASWITDVHYLGLPDVYSEEWEAAVEERAQEQCAPRRDDPWLLGYFLANEPPFPQKALQTAELILAGPATATRAELVGWLEDGDTGARREEFVGRAFDRYVQVTSAAVKRHDPNHLNLGMRGGGRPTEAEIRAARAFDVYSVNVYDYQVPAERVREIARLTGKPIVIGEFHFGAPGRGLAASLVQVRDQEQRGVAYRYYVEQAFAMPELIGTHYFQWADQPSTGRFDGENYNIGLVDVTDRPYASLTDALRATHRRLREVHAGRDEPFSQRAIVN